MLTIAVAFIGFAAAGFIIYPLMKRESSTRRKNRANNGLKDPAVKKESVYANLKELEFDYRTGKLSREDYEGLRSELEDIAVSLLRKADRVKEEKDKEKTIEEEIELEVLKIRKKKNFPPHKERRKDK